MFQINHLTASLDNRVSEYYSENKAMTLEDGFTTDRTSTQDKTS